MKKKLLSCLLVFFLAVNMVPSAFATQNSFSLSDRGMEFIKSYEVFEPKAYQKEGKWYIGYGTPCAENEYPDGITKEKAEELLRSSLASIEKSVNNFISTNALTLKQHEFDALVSFTYCLGTSWMDSKYRLAKYVIAGMQNYEPAEIVDAVGVWCHVQGKVDQEQLERRIDEGRLLLYGDYDLRTSPEFFALILDADGGSIVNDTVCYQGGKPYENLPHTTRANYTFDGWYLENGQLISSQTVSETLRIKARWLPGNSLTFRDVNKGDWFYTYVYDLYLEGIINGYTAHEFAPQNPVTLAQSLKLVLLAAGHGEKSPTDKHWASGYLSYAISKGYLPAGTYRLDDPTSRLEIAHLAAKALGLNESTTKSPFSDTQDTLVMALYDLKIIEGSQEGGSLVFKPNDKITRAEISAIIWRIARSDAAGANKPKPEPKPDPKPNPPANSNQFQYNGQWLTVLPGVPLNPYNNANFYKSNGYTLYRSTEYTNKTGVDVSVYQGSNIDWNQVKAAGVDFAIIRVGGRGWGSEGKVYADNTAKKNIEGAIAAGLDVGVYFFSQAISVEEAREEAQFTLDAIKGYNITYPVVFDWERIGGDETRTYGLSTSTLCAAANAFCSTVESAGYKPMIYFNSYCGYMKYDLSKIMEYEFWFAQYTDKPNFYYNFHMWQYTSSGSVPGIPGKVDLNLYLIKK